LLDVLDTRQFVIEQRPVALRLRGWATAPATWPMR